MGGGVIGGKEQCGKWKMDVRYNKKDLIQRIQRISTYKNRIEIRNDDACRLITNLNSDLSKDTLFYIDPPYYNKGKELYQHHYGHEDHIQVRDTLKGIKKQKWILTYDDVPQIYELYRGYRQIQYSLSYTAQKKRKGSEIMIFDNNISIPNMKSPVSVFT